MGSIYDMKELVDKLDREYPDTVSDLKTEKDLLIRQAQREMIGYIKILTGLKDDNTTTK